MKKFYYLVSGLVLTLLGIAIIFYVGLGSCFFGGIVGIINAIKAPEPLTIGSLIWNILRILAIIPVGLLCIMFFIGPGLKQMSKS